jgi:hypothetical protein
VNGVGMKLCML